MTRAKRSAEGFCIYDSGTTEILIRTVSDTKRAAIVNGLYVVFGIPITNHWTDGMIYKAWELSNKSNRYMVWPVTVHLAANPSARTREAQS